MSLVVADVPDMASSSLLDLAWQDPSANVMVFMERDTKLRGSKGAENEEIGLSEHPLRVFYGGPGPGPLHSRGTGIFSGK